MAFRDRLTCAFEGHTITVWPSSVPMDLRMIVMRVTIQGMSSEAAEAMAAMIASRAEERQAAYERRQTAKVNRAMERADLNTRRGYGLIARHRRKLAHAPVAQRLV